MFTKNILSANIPLNNLGGGYSALYWNLCENIAFIPTVPQIDPRLATSAADSAVIDAEIELVTDMAGEPIPDNEFRKLYVTPETVGGDSTLIGEVDGRGFDNILTFFEPGQTENLIWLLHALSNASVIFIFKDTNGKLYLYGNASRPMKMETAADTTGKAAADRKGSEISFKYSDFGPAPILASQIKTGEIAAVPQYQALDFGC